MNEYLKIKQASKFLGVGISTMIKMDRDGDLVAYKMPGSKYRLYTKLQLENFLRSVQDANKSSSTPNEFMGIKSKEIKRLQEKDIWAWTPKDEKLYESMSEKDK